MAGEDLDQPGPGPLSSLVLLRRSVPNEDRCPRRIGWRFRHVETGELRPARCGAHGCPWCGPVNARQVAGALGRAEPERLITLSQVGDDWQQRRGRMKRLAYCLRKDLGARHQWAWHVEPNPKATGYHAHCYQRGDFITQRSLSRLADRCGMGRVVDIRKFERPKGTAGIHYGLKLVGIDYGLKLTAAGQMMATYLEANGGRLVHASRGFFDGGLRAAMRQPDLGEDGGRSMWVLELGEVGDA